MSTVDLGITVRQDRVFEQVVMAEVLIPDTFNAWGDYYTKEVIKQFAYKFAQHGYGLDVDHDKVDVSNVQFFVCESFIARPGDPDFIEGSWVIGVKVLDSELWQRILAGEINGFSYQADVLFVDLEWDRSTGRIVTGMTEPDPYDGHVHTFLVVLDGQNRVVSGYTGPTDDHDHPVLGHSVTGLGGSPLHTHRFQVIEERKND